MKVKGAGKGDPSGGATFPFPTKEQREMMSMAVETTYAEGWCMALHGNHDEHQCHKKPGHQERGTSMHECYCGVWWCAPSP